MKDLIGINAAAADVYRADRRFFLKSGLFSLAALGFWTPALAQAAQAGRNVRIMNAHTGETFSGEYWHEGRYRPDAFAEIKKIMRDHRTDEKFPIDPRLIDILYVLQRRLDRGKPFDLFSGYRSPASNAMLRRSSEGVARNSLHMSGQAADINLPGIRLSTLKATAIGLKSGGVGFYPKSDFVHVDTGRVRTW